MLVARVFRATLAIVERLRDAGLSSVGHVRPLGFRNTVTKTTVEPIEDVPDGHAAPLVNLDVPGLGGEDPAGDPEVRAGRVGRELLAHPGGNPAAGRCAASIIRGLANVPYDFGLDLVLLPALLVVRQVAV